MTDDLMLQALTIGAKTDEERELLEAAYRRGVERGKYLERRKMREAFEMLGLSTTEDTP